MTLEKALKKLEVGLKLRTYLDGMLSTQSTNVVDNYDVRTRFITMIFGEIGLHDWIELDNGVCLVRKEDNKKSFRYEASGLVFGNNWGGGKSSYKSKVLSSENLDSLKAQILNDIKSGSLDGGMGFANLIGALMRIKTTTSILNNGELFENVYIEDYEWFGSQISDVDMDFMYDCLNGG